MANYYSGSDLVADILFRAGEPTDGTSDFNAVALQYLNRAYQIIWMGGSELDPSIQEEWWWLRKPSPGILTIQPCIDSSKVNVTRGATGITFSSAPSPAIDKSLASGWFFKADGDTDVFRIVTHASGTTSAVLDSTYTGTTATGKSYLLFKAEYALATDVLRVIAPLRVYADNHSEIQGGDLMSLERDYPLNNIMSGVPSTFAHVGEHKIRFSHYGGAATGDLYRSEYDYLCRPADLTNATGSVPVVPQQYRKTLADAGLFLLYMDKNDGRADGVGLMAKSGIRAMSREHRNRMSSFSRDHGRISPRAAGMPPGRGPLRTSAGLIIG